MTKGTGQGLGTRVGVRTECERVGPRVTGRTAEPASGSERASLGPSRLWEAGELGLVVQRDSGQTGCPQLLMCPTGSRRVVVKS